MSSTQPPTSRREEALMSHLNAGERSYVRGMKRKERGDMGRLLDAQPTKAVPIRIRVLVSRLPDAIKTQMFHDLGHTVSDKYLQWCVKMLKMPLGVYHTPPTPCFSLQRALHAAKDAMDQVIVGQEAAKREVLKIVHQSLCNPNEPPTAYALGLEGLPGCGKTQFVQRAMKAALRRPIISVPLGASSDGVSFLWGHSYSYEGSKEGRLAGGLMEVGCCNPIVHFDEVDKVFDRDRGGNELISSLIHLIDPSANTALRDRYLHGLDIDFSKCIFVFSYNHPEKINEVLLNRIKRLEFEVPTREQKKEIVRTQLLPRAQRRIKTTITLEESALAFLLELSEKDAGLRDLEKSIDHVVSCASLNQILKGGSSDVVTLAFAQETMGTFLHQAEQPPPQMYT
jgi:ATP-dependent Lon protease